MWQRSSQKYTEDAASDEDDIALDELKALRGEGIGGLLLDAALDIASW